MSKRPHSENSVTETSDHECPSPIKKPKDDDTPSTSRNDDCITPENKGTREYDMDHPFRGHAVIFHQSNYKQCITRWVPCKCPNIEVQRLSDTLTDLGFEVTTHRNLSFCKIKRVLKDLTENTDHTSADCIVVVMLAHSRSNNLLCAKTCTFSIEELWMPFCATKCPSLAGKPKIFFVEACQQECLPEGMTLGSKATSQLASSSHESYVIPECADFLIVYNIMKGSAEGQIVERCSRFIKSLCEKLEELSPNMDLLKIMTRLTSKVVQDLILDVSDTGDIGRNRKNCVPHINSTLTRDVYFYPKTQEQ